MKAWPQTEYGGVEVLKIVEVPKPTSSTHHGFNVIGISFCMLGPRDLLGKVVATATNPVPISPFIH